MLKSIHFPFSRLLAHDSQNDPPCDHRIVVEEWMQWNWLRVLVKVEAALGAYKMIQRFLEIVDGCCIVVLCIR